ncbi:hypothetical protein LTR37_006300 [Vermiconidia calcicola]|uniref:Uncharacterized protein n=1 Tax=Vermiconidia calcicola TaxID=1690605 RepID=A0ACC3NH49_9PEZI|nr:hypothetical protein LTR37_006300 [Vermiconidia calcicola]
MRTYYNNFCLERSLRRPHGLGGYCYNDCPPRPPFQGLFFVIANKIDRDQAEWEISIEEGKEFCLIIGAIFMPMSAKTGEGSGSQAVLEMANHIFFRRIQNTLPLDGNTPPDETRSQSSAGDGGTRRAWWRSIFSRRPVENERKLDNDTTLNEKRLRAAISQSRELSNPNALYWY